MGTKRKRERHDCQQQGQVPVRGDVGTLGVARASVIGEAEQLRQAVSDRNEINETYTDQQLTNSLTNSLKPRDHICSVANYLTFECFRNQLG